MESKEWECVGLYRLVSGREAIQCYKFQHHAAAQKQFLSELSGGNEAPPVTTTATGVGKFQMSSNHPWGELRKLDTNEIASFIQLLHTSAASGEGSLASDVVFDN